MALDVDPSSPGSIIRGSEANFRPFSERKTLSFWLPKTMSLGWYCNDTVKALVLSNFEVLVIFDRAIVSPLKLKLKCTIYRKVTNLKIFQRCYNNESKASFHPLLSISLEKVQHTSFLIICHGLQGHPTYLLPVFFVKIEGSRWELWYFSRVH